MADQRRITSWKELDKALRKAGCYPIRSRTHVVWEAPNGRRFSVPYSASDHRAIRNLTSHLRKLGVDLA